MPEVALQILGTYQNDISNLRSHHWKYWLDLYSNCYYNCAYCVYRGPGQMERVIAHPERLPLLRADLRTRDKRSILYLGPKSDVYQPLERKLRLTRAALNIALEERAPVFIVTRSPFILDDLGLLRDMAELGLVEVSITIASPQALPKIEPHTAPVEDRLELIRTLSRSGISTSVHFSPIVPYLDSPEEIHSMMEQIVDAGAACIYACVLGSTSNYHKRMVRLLNDIDEVAARNFVDVFGAVDTDRVYSASSKYVVELTSDLYRFAATRSVPFACVHIPPFDTVERCGGIFRFKVPTVGDMVRHLDRIGVEELHLAELVLFLKEFAAVDDDYLAGVNRFWREGELFKNTYFHPRRAPGGELTYQRKSFLDLAVTNMRVTARDV